MSHDCSRCHLFLSGSQKPENFNRNRLSQTGILLETDYFFWTTSLRFIKIIQGRNKRGTTELDGSEQKKTQHFQHRVSISTSSSLFGDGPDPPEPTPVKKKTLLKIWKSRLGFNSLQVARQNKKSDLPLER